MTNLRSKLWMLIIAMFIVASPLCAQSSVDDETKSPVITQGIESSTAGISYWTSEKETAGVYCTPETKDICLDMNTRCAEQVNLWTAELDNQVRIGSQYVVHSASYWTAKKYLGWAREALDAVKILYSRTHIRELQFIITAMEQAIEVAEKIVALFNK